MFVSFLPSFLPFVPVHLYTSHFYIISISLLLLFFINNSRQKTYLILLISPMFPTTTLWVTWAEGVVTRLAFMAKVGLIFTIPQFLALTPRPNCSSMYYIIILYCLIRFISRTDIICFWFGEPDQSSGHLKNISSANFIQHIFFTMHLDKIKNMTAKKIISKLLKISGYLNKKNVNKQLSLNKK